MARNNTMHMRLYFRASRKYFNMIEVTLAIAIVALGLVGILSLFPVGFQSIRDSIGDNYVNDASQLFLSYIKLYAKQDTSTPPTPPTQAQINAQWDLVIGNIPVIKPDAPSYPSLPTVDTVDPSKTGWTTTTVPNLYYKPPTSGPPPIPGTPGLYRIYSGMNDFKAAVRVWKTRTVSPIHTTDWGTTLNPISNAHDYDNSCALNIEFSWPIEKPYAQRTKRFFYYELFKPQLQ